MPIEASCQMSHDSQWDCRNDPFLTWQLRDTCPPRRKSQPQVMQTKVLRKWSQVSSFSASTHTVLLWPRKQQTRKVFPTTPNNRIFLLAYASGRKKKFHFVALSKASCWSPLLPPRCPGQSIPCLGRFDFPTSRALGVLCPFLKKTLGIPFFGALQLQGANCPQFLAHQEPLHNKPFASMRAHDKTAPVTTMYMRCPCL